MLPVRCAMHTALCELQWRCAEWADLDAPQCLDSLSPKWGPAPRYTVHNFAFDPLHRTSAFQPLYTTQQSRGNSRARPQTFSPPSSVASAFKERKKCFCKIQFCLSLPSPPFRPFNWLTSADICILPLFLGFVFFPTLPTSEWPNRWTRSIQRRIPAVCFTHFPHICIKFEKLLSTNTKFIPEKSRSLDFPIMCRGTCSILNRKSDESDSKEQN